MAEGLIHLLLITIVPGSATHCEVVIVGMEEGLISTNMLCSVRYSDTPLPLQVEAYIQVSTGWKDDDVVF